jgi:translation initiation factor IF-2
MTLCPYDAVPEEVMNMIHKDDMISPKAQKSPGPFQPGAEPKRKLDIVLKTDSFGTREAIMSAIKAVRTPEVELEVIQSDIGNISQKDLFLAETGSRLVIGFNVGILAKVKELAKEQQVEVRLYDVIYKLLDDLKKTALSLLPNEEKEEITGRAKVIALFSGGRKSLILGCEVTEGTLALGKKFRVISAPGPVYEGTVESLHIEKSEVKEAKSGQQVGLKIPEFKRAKIGDLVECYVAGRPKGPGCWEPKGGVFRY